MNKKIVMIKTTYGKILTVNISKQTSKQIFGTDKFGDPVIIPIEDIKSMVSYDQKKDEIRK